jgi:hypothetical protein
VRFETEPDPRQQIQIVLPRLQFPTKSQGYVFSTRPLWSHLTAEAISEKCGSSPRRCEMLPFFCNTINQLPTTKQHTLQQHVSVGFPIGVVALLIQIAQDSKSRDLSIWQLR